MKIATALLASLVAGCLTGPAPSDDGPRGNGKADGGDSACTTTYVEWLILTYKPAVEAKPLDAARATELTALAASRPCQGIALTSTAWTTWIDTANLEAFAPYFHQHADAMVGYLMPARPEHGDYDAYVRNTAVRDATRRAVQAIEAVRPIVSVDRLDMKEWIDLYHAQAEEVLTRVFDPALIGTREGYYFLNAGEREALDLFASTRPKPTQTHDGAFAAWIEEYGDVLQHGFSIDQEDDYRAGVACSQDAQDVCDREAVLDRMVALAPPAHGDEDSTEWMWQLSLWASLEATSQAPFEATDRQQLARIDAVRPMKLSGEGAYKVWLEIVADVGDHAEVMASSVTRAKPCASGTAADTDYAAFKAANASLDSSVLASAAPAACH